MRHLSFVLSATTILALCVFPGRSAAFLNPAKQAAQNKSHAAVVNELHSIKTMLEHADHDYEGHRAAAVKDISAAIHELEPGHKGHEEHKGKHASQKVAKIHEPQAASDAQLREALKQLEGMRQHFGQHKGGKGGHEKVAGHISHAIEELEAALKIK
jgi:hypothetical protein